MKLRLFGLTVGLGLVLTLSGRASAFQPETPPPGDAPRGPGGFPGGPGRGGPAGPMMGERKIVKQFDNDGDGRLSAEERSAAREELKKSGGNRRGPGGGGPGGMRPPGMGGDEPASAGAHIEKADVAPVKGGLYDEGVLRTIFLDFADGTWEDELSDFMRTDVEVPATMTVDGKEYPGVGVSFRGASSLMMVGKGSKRSLNVSVDFSDDKLRLHGVKSLNLLNSHEDASFMRAVLYLGIAQAMGIPAPRANFVRVVINGENWGVYTNAEQFNADMLARLFPKTKGAGARWKVPGSPMGRGGLEYLGDEIEKYRQRYEIKSKDDEKAWRALITLCKTLNETPEEQLEAAISPMLDIDGVLKFLALENALVNSDGYWIRASDYSIYLDDRGVFHILPHDANETLSPGMGPGGPGMRGPRPPRDIDGGPGGDARPDRPIGFEPANQPAGDQGPRQPGENRPAGPQRRAGGQVDPLIGLDDATKPLRSRLLKVPALRDRYLSYVRDIADQWLDWKTLGPIVERHRALIDGEIKADTKKLSSYDAFLTAVSAQAAAAAPQPEGGRRPGGRNLPLKQFADQRRAYLLNHAAVKALPPRDR